MFFVNSVQLVVQDSGPEHLQYLLVRFMGMNSLRGTTLETLYTKSAVEQQISIIFQVPP